MTSVYKTLRSDKSISIMMIVFGICEAITPLFAIPGGAYSFYVAVLFYFVPTAIPPVAVGILSIFCGIFSLKTGKGHALLRIVFTLCLFVLTFLVSIFAVLLEGWLYSIPIVRNHVLIFSIIDILFLLLYSFPALLAAFSVSPIAAIIVSVSCALKEIAYYFIYYNDMKQAYLFLIIAQLIISVAVVSYVTYRYGYGRDVKRLLLSLFCGLTDGLLVKAVFNLALLFIIVGKLTGPGLSSIILFVLACIWHIVIIWEGKRNLSKKDINESCERD